ncbi:TPA: S26 family signal peptidase, partial [Citrobacter freundii]
MTRLGYAFATTAAVSLLGITSIASFAPKLVWNASASTPIGLYAIGEPGRVDVTDLVAVRAPEPLATFLSDGGYLPRGVPLMKHVAALPGQRVCRTGLA